MKHQLPFLLPHLFILLGAAGLAGCASSSTDGHAGGGTATVRFTQPEKYTDLQRSDTTAAESRKVLLPIIERCVQQEAARSLPPGQHLTVEFLDIDQAGWIRPTGPHRVRVVTDNRPARLVFKYDLRDASGTMLKTGQETLVGFAGEQVASARDAEEMAAEKGLLREWIRRLAR